MTDVDNEGGLEPINLRISLSKVAQEQQQLLLEQMLDETVIQPMNRLRDENARYCLALKTILAFSDAPLMTRRGGLAQIRQIAREALGDEQ